MGIKLKLGDAVTDQCKLVAALPPQILTNRLALAVDTDTVFRNVPMLTAQKAAVEAELTENELEACDPDFMKKGIPIRLSLKTDDGGGGPDPDPSYTYVMEMRARFTVNLFVIMKGNYIQYQEDAYFDVIPGASAGIAFPGSGIVTRDCYVLWPWTPINCEEECPNNFSGFVTISLSTTLPFGSISGNLFITNGSMSASKAFTSDTSASFAVNCSPSSSQSGVISINTIRKRYIT